MQGGFGLGIGDQAEVRRRLGVQPGDDAFHRGDLLVPAQEQRELGPGHAVAADRPDVEHRGMGFLDIGHVPVAQHPPGHVDIGRGQQRDQTRGFRHGSQSKVTVKCCGKGVPPVSIPPAGPSARRRFDRASSGFRIAGMIAALIAAPKQVCIPCPQMM